MSETPDNQSLIDKILATNSKEVDELIEFNRQAAQNFDKTILTLSTGALALSIAFIEKIAPTPQVKWLLAFAWGAFILSAIITMVSFLVSQLAARMQKEDVDRGHTKELQELGVDVVQTYPASEIDHTNTVRSFNKAITAGNWAAYAFFIMGAISLTCFAYCNLPTKEKSMSGNEKKEIQSVVRQELKGIFLDGNIQTPAEGVGINEGENLLPPRIVIKPKTNVTTTVTTTTITTTTPDKSTTTDKAK